jgi:hypothetical protein
MENVKQAEVAREIALRDERLAELMFDFDINSCDGHEKHFDSVRNKFLEEKKDKNMGQRMALALQQPYLEAIHVVELGATSEFDKQSGLAELDHQYDDLRRWLIKNSWIKEELPRGPDTRHISFSRSALDSNLPIVTRMRALVSETIPLPSGAVLSGREEVDGYVVPVKLNIAKRMVFAMSRQSINKIDARSGYKDLQRPDILETIYNSIDEALSAPQHHDITPIRTSYYLNAELQL